MAIKWLNDLNLNNTSAAITATLYGEFNAVGNSSTNNYTFNGYSSNGLDNSVSFTSSSGGNNQLYVQKNNFFTGGSSSYMCLGFNLAEYNYQYCLLANSFSTAGVGTQYSSAISANNQWLVVSGATNLSIYENNGTGTWSHSSTISPTNGQVRSVAFNALGNLLLVGAGSGEAQSITSYPVSSSGIGSTGTTVASLSANSDYICSDPANYYIGVAMDQGAGAAIYGYNFGTQTYSSTNLIAGNGPASAARCIAWSPNGTYMACAGNGGATINLYTNNYSGTFTKSTITTSSPSSSMWGMSFSPDSQWLAVATSTSSHYIILYKNNDDGTFTNVTTITQPAGSLYDCHFSTDGNYLIGVGTSSPYITVWKNVGGTFSIVSEPSLNAAVSTTECGPILSLNDKTVLVPVATSNGNVYTFSIENKIALISTTTTTGLNTATIPPNSSLLVTLTADSLNFYFTNSSGVVTSNSVPLVNIGLSNTLVNCYMEIEINSTVANLWVNNSLALQVSDPTLINFMSNNLTLTFFNYAATSNAATNNAYINNVYLIDGTGSHNNSRLGPITIDTYYPNSDNTVAWTPSSGTTHYTLIDDNPPSSTTYVSTTTQGTEDTLNLATQSTPTTVYASAINIIAETTGGQAGELIVTSDSVNKNIPAVATSYTLYQQLVDNPTLGTTVSYEYSS